MAALIDLSRNNSPDYKDPYMDGYGHCVSIPLWQVCNFIIAFFLRRYVSEYEELRNYTHFNYRFLPYQDNTLGDNANFAPPVYNKFIDASYEIADKVELIHPARFLFNAGSTPKDWNQKILNDTHFKVLDYEQDSSKIFPNTDIKGGIVISFHDKKKELSKISRKFPKYFKYSRKTNFRYKKCRK